MTGPSRNPEIPKSRRRHTHGAALLPAACRLAQRDAANGLVAALNEMYGAGAAAISWTQTACCARDSGGIVTWRLHIAVDLVLPETPMEAPDA